MLPLRVTIPAPPDPTQEDIFSSALGVLFTDDTTNSHGTPGQHVIYSSPRHGDIKLGIPRHPDVEEGRKLFAHYLWNAGVVAAEAIERASTDDHEEAVAGKVRWDRRYWDVTGRDTLELGAGTGLPSLIAALSGANSTTITDHPSSPALISDTIARNILENLHVNLLPSLSSPDPACAPSPRTSTTLSIHGLTWGDKVFSSPFHYGKASSPQPASNSFDRIIIADCLWMPHQHANIVKTIDQNLRMKAAGAKGHEREPCALVVAGFHTGRSIVARFFEIATGSRSGVDGAEFAELEQENDEEDEDVQHVKGVLRAAEIFEVDVDCNVRPWQAERLSENRETAKRWVVCAALVRRRKSETGTSPQRFELLLSGHN